MLKGLQLAELLHEPNNLGLTANLSAFGMRFREESLNSLLLRGEKGGAGPREKLPLQCHRGDTKNSLERVQHHRVCC